MSITKSQYIVLLFKMKHSSVNLPDFVFVNVSGIKYKVTINTWFTEQCSVAFSISRAIIYIFVV